MCNDKPWIKELKKAMKRHNEGDINGSLEDLLQLNAKYPGVPPILGLIGRAYYELEDFGASAMFFFKTVNVSPSSELASLGLFHSYLEIGNKEKAMEEMRRFLAISSSNEYELIKKEMKL